MNLKLKHIELFEEKVLGSKKPSIFYPIFELKEVAEKAASFNNYQEGIDLINSHLKNNAWKIVDALNNIKTLPGGHFGNNQFMINIYSLLFPFIEKWGKEALSKELSNDIELDNDDDIETKDDDLSFDFDDIEIDD